MGDQQHRVYKFAQHEPVVIDGRGASNAERVTASAAYSPPIREQLIGTPRARNSRRPWRISGGPGFDATSGRLVMDPPG